jgi:multisubunit Na+/H+ antiporter MnhC subunit
MQPNELVGGPRDLLMLALVVVGVGAVLFLIANLIMKVIGLDINEHAYETRRYKNMGFFEQMTAFHSDARNIPAAIGAGGLFLVFGAVLIALGAGAWFLVRAVSG